MKKLLVEELSKIAPSQNIQLAACRNDFERILQPSCINAGFIQSADASPVNINRDKHQRKNCHCI